MSVQGQLYPLCAPSPYLKTVSGHFAGINGADPTSVVGSGFTVTRSGEGVWVVTFPKPVAGIISPRAWVTDADGAYHEVTWTTSVANRTLTITHRWCTYATIEAVGPVVDDVVDQISFEAVIVLSDVGVVVGV